MKKRTISINSNLANVDLSAITFGDWGMFARVAFINAFSKQFPRTRNNNKSNYRNLIALTQMITFASGKIK